MARRISSPSSAKSTATSWCPPGQIRKLFGFGRPLPVALLDDMPLTNCERIWGGMKARITVVHRRVGPGSGYAIQMRPQSASGGEEGALACTYRIFAGNRG
jgi:hypothetical protein